MAAVGREMTASQYLKRETSAAAVTPAATPKIPLAPASRPDSNRNCSRTSPRVAPSARRSSISGVLREMAGVDQRQQHVSMYQMVRLGT